VTAVGLHCFSYQKMKGGRGTRWAPSILEEAKVGWLIFRWCGTTVGGDVTLLHGSGGWRLGVTKEEVGLGHIGLWD
jgi:hypothetical protein